MSDEDLPEDILREESPAPRSRGALRKFFLWATSPVRGVWTSNAPLDAFTLVHATSVMGDGIVAIAFLNTVFSAPTTSQDKGHAALFLALTFAPLAVAGLLLAPLLDRAGPRRTISFASAASRSVLAIYLAPRLGTLAFFPLAFLMLVCVKIEVITKNSLTVAYADEERKLVQANARLGVWSVVCAMIGAGIGALALKLSGGMAVLYSASVVYVASAFLNLRLPHPRAPKRERTVVNKLGRIPELRIASAGRIGLGVAQGFLILLLGFSLRESHEPTWWSYLLAGAALLGGVVGDLIVPRLPSWIREEAIVLGSLVAAGIGALIAFEFFSFGALLVYCAIAGLMTEFGRLAFQARMQRVVPEWAHGRVFARYEVAFQLAWVAGAFIPALLPIDFRAGILMMGAFYLFVAATWMVRPLAAQRKADRANRPESGNPFL